MFKILSVFVSLILLTLVSMFVLFLSNAQDLFVVNELGYAFGYSIVSLIVLLLVFSLVIHIYYRIAKIKYKAMAKHKNKTMDNLMASFSDYMKTKPATTKPDDNDTGSDKSKVSNPSNKLNN